MNYKGQVSVKGLTMVIVIFIIAGILITPLSSAINSTISVMGEGTPAAFILLATLLVFSGAGFYALGRAGQNKLY